MPQAPDAALPLTDAAEDPAFLKLRRRLTNRWLVGLFMLAKFPLGFFAGLRVKSLTRERCETTVPFGWRTQNPFRSMYFAAQAMAAELSTGALALAAAELAPASVATLIVGIEGQFSKKAASKVTFTCEEGERFFAAARRTVATGEAVQVAAQSIGRLSDGTEVSRFTVTWSLKKRSA
ncbi:MAG: DUF4442 domain-containing protein [Acidobacteria bacterium]|nr:MAG: DUF4442 domain-containing protein [Acidobacteriota bacterium]